MKITSLKDKIIEYICDAIVQEKYKQKDQIKEAVLAKELNVSRAPVREALNELVNLGILVQFPRRGVFVKEIKQQNIINTYKTKGLIEGFLASEFVLRATKNDFKEIDRFIGDMEKAAHDSQKKCIKIGDEFHKYYLKYALNDILIDTLQRVNKKSQILFHKNWAKLYTPKEIVNRHKKIANILKSKDKELIEIVIREHYFETGMKIALECGDEL